MQAEDRVERPQRREQALQAAARLPGGLDRAGLETQAVAPDHEHTAHRCREDVGDDAAGLVRRAEQAPALAQHDQVALGARGEGDDLARVSVGGSGRMVTGRAAGVGRELDVGEAVVVHDVNGKKIADRADARVGRHRKAPLTPPGPQSPLLRGA